MAGVIYDPLEIDDNDKEDLWGSFVSFEDLEDGGSIKQPIPAADVEEQEFFNALGVEYKEEVQEEYSFEEQQIKVNDNDALIEIPLEGLQELLATSNTVSIPIHDILVSVNLNALEKMGVDFNDSDMIALVSKSMEAVLSPEEVLNIRKTQSLAISTGVKFKIESGAPLKDFDNMQVLVPDLCSKIQIEILNKSVDESGFHKLSTVKDEFVDEARGLKRVIKNEAAAEVLNAIQLLKPDDEVDFYLRVLTKMQPLCPTRVFALGLLRHVMQYALNVDNLSFKAILTEELIDNDD